MPSDQSADPTTIFVRSGPAQVQSAVPQVYANHQRAHPTSPSYFRSVGTQHAALEWLSRRHDGESCGYIAQRAGVTAAVVRAATERYGPFPGPTRHAHGRVVHAEPDARAADWVRARQQGQQVQAIADAAGVSHQYVSKMTAGHGPYPSADVIQEWVEMRRAGRPVADIAAASGTSTARVLAATRSAGPFYRRGSTLPNGVVGVAAIARMCHVPTATVLRWRRNGRLPPRTGPLRLRGLSGGPTRSSSGSSRAGWQHARPAAPTCCPCRGTSA